MYPQRIKNKHFTFPARCSENSLIQMAVKVKNIILLVFTLNPNVTVQSKTNLFIHLFCTKYDADFTILHISLQWPHTSICLLLRLVICLQQYLQYPYTLSLLPSLYAEGFPRHSLTLLSLLCCWYSVTRITLLTQSKMAASICELTCLLFLPCPSLSLCAFWKAWKTEKDFKKCMTLETKCYSSQRFFTATCAESLSIIHYVTAEHAN